MPARRRSAGAWILAAVGALAGCAAPQTPAAPPVTPIVFVHGNGDSAALWKTTLWRFESNGWPRERLHAVDLPLPLARDDDTVPQPGRSSADEFARHLAVEVDAVLARTGARQVALVGNSRGGLAIRHYVRNFGGASRVSHAVLGGTPNHGVWADAGFAPRSEFNGAGPFLQALNRPQGPEGEEVTPGVRWLTLRSDRNDKFAQPEGTWIGRRGQPTNVGFDGPALKGAEDLVLPRRDHREVSFHPEAFEATYRFIAGRPAQRTEVLPEPRPVLDGRVLGRGPGGVTNAPVGSATVEVYVVDPATGARRGAAVHRRTTGDDGRWGPVTVSPTAHHEFVLAVPGEATTHIYRSPFPRSSAVVHLRTERLVAAERSVEAVVVFTRPRGYFGLPRDRVVLDGADPAPGIPPGVAGVSVSRRAVAGLDRPVLARFESEGRAEQIVGRTWPAAEGRITVIELHH
jgi:triacylglycerol lipase